jgi:hypothetical protein
VEQDGKRAGMSVVVIGLVTEPKRLAGCERRLAAAYDDCSHDRTDAPAPAGLAMEP